MNRLNELFDKCGSHFSIDVNRRKAYYNTVEEYITWRANLDEDLMDEIDPDIDPDVYSEMQARDTIIEIDAYPENPISCYVVWHYDIDKAIDLIIDCLNEENNGEAY